MRKIKRFLVLFGNVQHNYRTKVYNISEHSPEPEVRVNHIIFQAVLNDRLYNLVLDCDTLMIETKHKWFD